MVLFVQGYPGDKVEESLERDRVYLGHSKVKDGGRVIRVEVLKMKIKGQS